MVNGRYKSFNGSARKALLTFIFLLLLSNWITGRAEERADTRIDSELKNLWNGMVTRLIERDIEGALEYVTYSTRGRYREQFMMVKDRLPAIFSGMRNIEPVYIKGDEAKYRIRIKEEGGEPTSYLWFRKDIFGRWKIDKF